MSGTIDVGAIVLQPTTTSSASTSATCNSRIGQVTYTHTLAEGTTTAYTISNSIATSSSIVMIQIYGDISSCFSINNVVCSTGSISFNITLETIVGGGNSSTQVVTYQIYN